jgi:acyl carrier protein
MDSHSHALVHHLVASRLHTDDAAIDDAQRLDELGLGPLDLVLIALGLEDLDRGEGDFPIAALEHATTVGDLVTLVEQWLRVDLEG